MKNKLFKSLLVLIMMIGVFATVSNVSLSEVKAATNAADAPADWAFTEDSIPLHDAILSKYDSDFGGTGNIDSNNDGYINKDEAAAYTGSISLDGMGISGTMNGIENFKNIGLLWLANNELTGSIPKEIGTMTSLTGLFLNSNNLSGEVPKELENLGLVSRLYLQSNNFTGVISFDFSKLINLNDFRYHYTMIEMSDLTGANNLSILGVTKATGVNTSNLTGLYMSGSKENNSSIVYVSGTIGFANWDNVTGYYEIKSGMNIQYRVGVKSLDSTIVWSSNVSISDSALMDNEGNLIIGANLTDVDIATGSVILPTGGTIITGEATYVFDKATTVAETEISTEGNITIINNTTDGSTVSTSTTTIVKVPEGSEATISLDGDGGTVNAPAGSVVTNNDGSETYLSGEGTVKEDGTITSSENTITVPTDKLNDVTINGSEVTFPAGIIVDDGSTSITYPGTIIYDTDNNTLTYLPVDGLFNEDGTLKDEVTQEDITNSQDFVTGLGDSALKTELQSKVEDAQNQLNERNAEKAVDDLFETDGKIKDTVTQEDIDNAKDLVDNLNDGDKKTELQDKLEDAQNQLNERNAEKAVYDLFDKDGNIKDTVTQDDIKNAEDLVNKLPDGQLKDELNDKLKEAQKQLDERNFVIIETFKVFTGEGTVYTKIDAPVEKFSSISVDGKELDASNYEVTSGSTVITLTEAYLKTLENGTYDVDVEFTSGAVVKTTLTVKVEGNPSKAPSTTNPNTYKPSTAAGSSTSSSTVDTGDTTNLTMLYALLASSLLGFVVIAKRRKEQN